MKNLGTKNYRGQKKKTSKRFSRFTLKRKIKWFSGLIVIVIIAIVGARALLPSRAATSPTVRFVYVYAADESFNSNSYSMLGSLSRDIRAFYKAQVGKDMNVSSVGARFQGNLTVAQYRSCPSNHSCPNGVEDAIYWHLYDDSRIRQPYVATLVITQFNRGDGINCGIGTDNRNGAATATGVVVQATAACQTYLRVLDAGAHELGHGFGLSRSNAGGAGHTADGSLMDADSRTTQCDTNWSACFLDSADRTYLKTSPFFANPATINGIAVARRTSSGLPGYWTLKTNGAVTAHGAAKWYGDVAGKSISGRVVDIASPNTGGGYWIVTSTGAVYSFGAMKYYGGASGLNLKASIVGIAASSSTGYWLLGADGGIFSYGSARFYGSTGAMTLNAPIVGMAAYPPGGGYWLVASDGGVFTFGAAPFKGSAGNLNLHAPVVGMASNLSGDGYWLVATDGGIFTYGGAHFYGSASGKLVGGESVRGMAATADGRGYWLYTNQNRIYKFGDAI